MIDSVSILKMTSESVEVSSVEQGDSPPQNEELSTSDKANIKRKVALFSPLLLAALLVYVPYINVILGLNRGAVIPQPFEPACQNQCAVNVPLSSVQEFNSFSLDRSHVVFVHFHVYNLSLQSSCTTDILDPLNLVWGESVEAPMLSLDLGFNVYSFTTLSRMIHHMKVNIKAESLTCLQSLNHSCLTATFAKSFLEIVTRGKGVLCYAVNDTNTVNYKCCKEDVRTKQVECDIPAVLSPEMTAIFYVIAIAAAIAFLFFPAIFNIIPDKENSDTLSSNIQVHNPLFQKGIRAFQVLQNASENCLCDTLRKIFIGITLPILYYVDLGLTYHIKTYDIPQMFNDCVKEFWAKSKIPVLMKTYLLPFWVVILFYNVVVIMFSFLSRNSSDLDDDERSLKLIWSIPWNLTDDIFRWAKSYLKCEDRDSSRFFKRSYVLSLVRLVLSTVVMPINIIGYALYISPLANILNVWSCLWKCTTLLCERWVCCCICCSCLALVGSQMSVLVVAIIFKESLLLSSRFIVYLLMGLVASKDYYFPRIAFISVFVYYSWDCVRSVTSRYQNLLQQTFEKCKVLQEQQPNTRKPLTFDDKGRPKISPELFQNVIDEILPRSEAYMYMVLKLTVIILFLFLTHYWILVFGITNLTCAESGRDIWRNKSLS